MTSNPPFFYKIIDNFLPEKELERIRKLYDSLKFKEIKSDLFSFMQSDELAEDERFEGFKFRIHTEIAAIFNDCSDDSGDNVVPNDVSSIPTSNTNDHVSSTNPNDLCSITNSNYLSSTNPNDVCSIPTINNNVSSTPASEYYFTFFASFYRKNDFLLCHDDMVDERLYAFTFYLEDFPSGSLILYENDCETVHRKVEIVSNRIVFFKVCEKSFHEVDFCKESGRKAISGWYNKTGHKNTYNNDNMSYYNDDMSHCNNDNVDHLNDISCNKLKLLDFGEDFNKIIIENGSFTLLSYKDIDDSYEISISGPFLNRRIYSVKFSSGEFYAPLIAGYNVIYYEGMVMKEGCYILCNDKINNQIYGDVIDVFIFKRHEDTSDYMSIEPGNDGCMSSSGVEPGNSDAVDVNPEGDDDGSVSSSGIEPVSGDDTNPEGDDDGSDANSEGVLISSLINYVDENSNTVFKLDAVDGTMVIGKRNGNSLCINRIEEKKIKGEVLIKHIIYNKSIS